MYGSVQRQGKETRPGSDGEKVSYLLSKPWSSSGSESTPQSHSIAPASWLEPALPRNLRLSGAVQISMCRNGGRGAGRVWWKRHWR